MVTAEANVQKNLHAWIIAPCLGCIASLLLLSFTYTLVSRFQRTIPVRLQQMSQRKGSVSLGRKEGSRRATCVYIAVSGTGSLPCHAPCVLFGSGHLLSGTTLVASDVSQNTLGFLYENTCFKELQRVKC